MITICKIATPAIIRGHFPAFLALLFATAKKKTCLKQTSSQRVIQLVAMFMRGILDRSYIRLRTNGSSMYSVRTPKTLCGKLNFLSNRLQLSISCLARTIL